MFSPQTIGPFGTRLGRWVGARSLRHARGVLARDPESAECAAQLGRAVDVLTTDVVFALDRVSRTPYPRRRREPVRAAVGGRRPRRSSVLSRPAHRPVPATAALRPDGHIAHPRSRILLSGQGPPRRRRPRGSARPGRRDPRPTRPFARPRAAGDGDRRRRVAHARLPERPVAGPTRRRAGLLAQVPAAARQPRLAAHHRPSVRRRSSRAHHRRRRFAFARARRAGRAGPGGPAAEPARAALLSAAHAARGKHAQT